MAIKQGYFEKGVKKDGHVIPRKKDKEGKVWYMNTYIHR